jgi:hypothetical protein
MVAKAAPARLVKRAFMALLMAALVSLSAVQVPLADDASAFRDLVTGGDFRVRVVAAMLLGKSKAPGARPALEKALGDPHPAVRAAAAAGLGALGDASALPALNAALAKETATNVQAQFANTIKRLSGAAAAASKPRFLIALGRLENKSGVSGNEIASALKSGTRSKMSQVPGVEVVADGTDISAAIKSRGLPGFTVDGSLMQLAKQQSSDGVGYAARVEYLIRKMPEQSLKGTMSGNAQALADAKQVRGQTELAQLQIDAVSAAIDSALKGASPTLEAASR